MLTAGEVIELLALKPLPMEGGYFRETYRSPDVLQPTALPSRYSSAKSASTAIYYLLTPDTQSRLHRLPTDEIFHFYLGGPVIMLQLLASGAGRTIILGNRLEREQTPQVVVPAGVWQGCFLPPEAHFALLGTTVAPGFDFADYEPGKRDLLEVEYPAFAALIRRLTPSD
jgi:predicted cupin superfamily sugar epimerase